MSEVVLVKPIVGHWDTSKTKPYFPLGLLKAASKVSKEFRTSLIDQRLGIDWKKELRKELSQSPLLVGVPSITGQQLSHALEVSQFVKKVSPETPVVWGGPHASALPEQTVRNSNVDIVIRRDGETPLLKVTRKLSKNDSLKGIKGVTYQDKSGRIKSNSEQKLPSLNSYPSPAYELVNMNDYIRNWRGRREVSIETSRGCPHACTFCYNKFFNKRGWRSISSDEVLEKMRFLMNNFNISSFRIEDDNFFASKKRALDLASKIIEEGLDLNYRCQGIRVDDFHELTDKELHLLEKSGLRQGNFGVESGSPRTLKAINKGITVKQITTVNKKLLNFNIIPDYNFIIGFPNEQVTDFKKTINLAFKLLKENPKSRVNHIAAFTPYPKTKLFRKSIKLGFEPPKSLEGWMDYGWDKVHLPWLSAKEKHFVESVYFLSNFMDDKIPNATYMPRIITFLSKIYKPISRFRLSNQFFSFMIEKEVKKLLLSDSEW